MTRGHDPRSEPPRTGAKPATEDTALNEREQAVIAALREVDFGEVGIVVHNARIVQITRSRKQRFSDG